MIIRIRTKSTKKYNTILQWLIPHCTIQLASSYRDVFSYPLLGDKPRITHSSWVGEYQITIYHATHGAMLWHNINETILNLERGIT